MPRNKSDLQSTTEMCLCGNNTLQCYILKIYLTDNAKKQLFVRPNAGLGHLDSINRYFH